MPSPSSVSSQRKRAFAEHIAEAMSGFAEVQIRPMFGGFGIYHQGLMFALIADGRLYFKTDDVSAPRFTTQGLAPFTYASRGKVASLRYHEAPAEAYEGGSHMSSWARMGFECALRQQAAKARSQRAKGERAGQKAASATTLQALRGLGPRSAEMLDRAGIKTIAQLRKLGAVRAYARARMAAPDVSLNLLWALEGALSDRDWREVAETERASLLMALEDVLKHGQP